MVFDFIVVGSGPAGSCLASRLAKSKKAPRVLLLEAGHGYDASNPNILAERWTSFMQYPKSNWGYTSVPQKHADDREINYPRGKALGGSSVINMCAYTVGPKDDYDRWAEEVDDEAFNWRNAVRLRKKIESFGGGVNEKYSNPDMCVHGTDGPLRIEYPKTLEPPVVAALDTAKECGIGLNLDINSGNPLGLGSGPATSRSGRRVTAAVAYLSDAPENLSIITDAQVTKIIFKGKKAVGVVANGEEYRASKDVVLSAGAIDTPKLLMLSGVGDKDELQHHGIECLHHLPAVGKHLEDHFFAAALWRQTPHFLDWNRFYTDPVAIAKGYEQFAKDGTGPLSVFYQGVCIGFFKADEILSTPEFAALPAHVQEHIQKPTVPIWEMATAIPAFHPSADPNESYRSIAIFLHNPASRGTVTLATSTPTDAPLIDPNFLSAPFDRVCAVAAGRRMLDFISHPAIAKDIIEPFHVPASRSEEDILAWWRASGTTTYHPSCTVKMGREGDAEACVDAEFRLYGMESLRVVDLSVTPFLPNCHPVSVAYLVGEVAAEKMVGEYGLDG